LGAVMRNRVTYYHDFFSVGCPKWPLEGKLTIHSFSFRTNVLNSQSRAGQRRFLPVVKAQEACRRFVPIAKFAMSLLLLSNLRDPACAPAAGERKSKSVVRRIEFEPVANPYGLDAIR
jgi:hypothetical protein